MNQQGYSHLIKWVSWPVYRLPRIVHPAGENPRMPEQKETDYSGSLEAARGHGGLISRNAKHKDAKICMYRKSRLNGLRTNGMIVIASHHKTKIDICRTSQPRHHSVALQINLPRGWLQLSCGFWLYLPSSSARMVFKSCK